MIGICRLCASVKKKETLTTIANDEHEICTRLQLCCQLMVKMSDNLPKTFCSDCIKALNQTYAFYNKVQEAQESLILLFPEKEIDVDSTMVADKTDGLRVITLNILPKNKSQKSDVTTKISPKNSAAVKTLKKVQIVKLETSDSSSAKCINVDESAQETMSIDILDAEDFDMNNEAKDLDSSLQLNDEGLNTTISTDSEDLYVKASPTATENEIAPTCTSPTLRLSKKLETDDHQHNSTESDCHTETNDVIKESNDEMHEILIESWSSYRWECLMCTEVFASFLDLKIHSAVEHETAIANIKFKCSDCQKHCPKYFTFINHIRFLHRAELALCCDACNASYANYAELAMHRKRCREAQLKGYPEIVLCTKCGRAYENRAAAQTHFRYNHTERDTSVCGHCDKAFKRINALQVHMKRVHEGVKEYHCSLCGLSFGQKVNLQTHMITHTNMKPYNCSVCGKSFKTSINLQKHALLHTEARQHKCDFCELRFRTKDAKLSHERTHTGEKPYQCKYCDRKFRFRSVLTSHLNIHTGARPYSCFECNHHFTNWSNFNKHLKRIHNTTATEASLAMKNPISLNEHPVELDNKSNSSEATTVNIVFEGSEDSSTMEEVIYLEEEEPNQN